LKRCGGRFADLIAAEPNIVQMTALRATEPIGRPFGSASLLDAIAARTGRDVPPGREEEPYRGLSKASP
jgi:hypothetical protein